MVQLAGSDALKKFDEDRSAGIKDFSLEIPLSSGGASAIVYTSPTLVDITANEQLRHELELDNTFQLDEFGGIPDENKVFQSTRLAAHKVNPISLICQFDDLLIC